MSLVGGYSQPFPGPETLYSTYYAARFETPGAPCVSSDASFFTPWTFAPTNQSSENSPHNVEHTVPPYVSSPGQQTSSTGGPIGSATGCDYIYSPSGVASIGPDGMLMFPERGGIKRRNTANKKERRRTLSINNAFADLRECIPNVPADTKLSKIKTLRLATSYIAYLMDLLAQDNPACAPNGGFKAELTKKFESRDEKRKTEIVSLRNTFE
ncbi:heart- and neural crest derivatives-expressed protein 2-like [Limulus polyphemus]|uniref:Heart- and neural crest derivatives-expressed protein 2 n=1 Tax=Limulus polyphemus TaxID=6850 RepID=A0ABM1C3L0_LIMPO|nr:heart- and neural crest derivatives-expressed protein 2-like [Limulus polyphemus]